MQNFNIYVPFSYLFAQLMSAVQYLVPPTANREQLYLLVFPLLSVCSRLKMTVF
jgi:hypothetical protein